MSREADAMFDAYISAALGPHTPNYFVASGSVLNALSRSKEYDPLGVYEVFHPNENVTHIKRLPDGDSSD